MLLGVFVAQSLPWVWVKSFTTATAVALSQALGLQVQQVAFNLMRFPDHLVKVTVPCTMLDYLFGAAPILWCVRRSLYGNLRLLALLALLLIPLNQIRLVAGFWLYAQGITWMWAHETITALAYFAITEWVFSQVAKEPGAEAGEPDAAHVAA